MIDTGRYINQDAGNSQQFEIRLGAGKNLYEIVQNVSTVVPPGFEIYMGCDPQNVPAGILGDRNDLAIHITSGMRMVQLSVKYLDTITGTYVGPITPRNFILTSDQEWGLWKDFSDIVIPHSSIITVLAAGCSCSCGGSGNNPGEGSGDVSDISVTVGSTVTLPAGQPAEVYNSGTNKNVVLNFRIPQGPQGIQGPAGQDGVDGYTPVKRVDYFTDDDVNEIAQKAAELVDVGIVPVDQISPDKVIFTEDVLTSYAVGNIKLTNGIGKLAEAGDSLSDMLEKVWLKETNPATTQPSVSLTFPQAGSYEVGTYVSPTYSATCSTGSYSYGSRSDDGSIVSGTAVTISDWSVTDSSGGVSAEAEGLFGKFQVTDTTNYTITAKATHTAGNTPVTNLKNDYAAGKIAAGTKSKTSAAVTGYRNAFYGTIESKDTPTSAIIRGLTTSGKALANGSSFSVNVPVNAQKVIIAYPNTLRDMASVKDVNGLNAEIVTGFSKSSVDVTGAENYSAISYKVYTMEFANPIETANTYTVVI